MLQAPAVKSSAALLASLPPDRRHAALAGFSDAQFDRLLYDWRFWARPAQVAPDGDWLTWLILAGRGFGKTRTGAEWVREQKDAGYGRIALIAPTAADARDTMVEGESGILATAPPWDRPIYEPSKRRLTWGNGAMATLFSAEEPERLRGPQHDAAWCFIAGTMVSTPCGPMPIETLKVGDYVLTRRGPRRVLGNTARCSVVGRVVFENGSLLVGTPDHPVYLSRGWTRLDQLREGDAACAIDALNGAGSAGTGTEKGAGRITSALTKAFARNGRFAFIAKSGSLITERSLATMKSIMLMVTWRTMRSAISHASQRGSTLPFIGRSILSPDGNRQGLPMFCSPAASAEMRFAGSAQRSVRFARHAQFVRPKSAGWSQGPACNAGPRSEAVLATSAVSVASTWRPEGEQKVFCLKVEGEPEYFANGILVHNCDELAAWKQPQETWDMLQFGLRLGDRPRQVITTTPKPIPTLKKIMASPTTVVTRGSTRENAANLAPSFLEQIVGRFAGTRLGRQELEAEILDDVPGALWTRAMIDAALVTTAPDMARVVVAIDPSGTGGEDDTGDSVGIVVAGLGTDGLGYILADRTCKLSPDGWGRQAVRAYHEFSADRIVAERNFGGAMVKHVIATVDRKAAYREVTASRGKVARAEPVAALYEQGKVKHVGSHTLLEDQMCSLTGDGFIGEGSPDRVDALVWALTELLLDGRRARVVITDEMLARSGMR